MRVFIAGVMQGSSHSTDVHCQEYRGRIEAALKRANPQTTIYDPWANHRESLTYDDLTGKQVFLEHNQMCGEFDVVVAYVPQASMGTAIEMWEAFRNGRVVISISPMAFNWAIKFISDHRFDSLDDFDAAADDGTLTRLLNLRPQR